MLNSSAQAHTNQRGLTLLELAVVIVVISAVGLVALNYYYKLMVDVERTTMERDVSAMRTAIGLQIAAHYAGGRMAELAGWTGGNPMERLVEPPDNYRGVTDHIDSELKKGSWYFDKKRDVLVYLVRNRLFFETELDSPARAEFQLVAQFAEGQTTAGQRQVSGLELRTIHPYRWVSPWN